MVNLTGSYNQNISTKYVSLSNSVTIGVNGFSAKPFDSRAARLFLKEKVSFIQQCNPTLDPVMITGGTAEGVPLIASEVASEYGIPLICTIPVAAYRDHCTFIQSARILLQYGVEWGDDSSMFIDLIRQGCSKYLVTIGGGDITKNELETVRSKHPKEIFVFEYKLPEDDRFSPYRQ